MWTFRGVAVLQGIMLLALPGAFVPTLFSPTTGIPFPNGTSADKRMYLGPECQAVSAATPLPTEVFGKPHAVPSSSEAAFRVGNSLPVCLQCPDFGKEGENLQQSCPLGLNILPGGRGAALNVCGN